MTNNKNCIKNGKAYWKSRYLTFNNPLIQKIMLFNPIAGAIDLVRSIFNVPQTQMGEGMNVNHLSLQFLTASLILLFGIYFFRKTESYFADLA